MPVMLFATVLYFCVFAVLTHRSAQTAAMQSGGTTVVLDAGHGGEDGGATGVSGTSEAALNLDISLRLRDLLRLCGVRVSMIRETDTAVYSDGCRTISEKKVSDIKNRTETVNQTENALLLSVHQNFFTEASTTAHRSSTRKRPAVRRWPSSCRPIWPWASSRATAVSAKNRTACISWSISAAPACWSNADFYPITRKNSGSCSRSIRKSWPP